MRFEVERQQWSAAVPDSCGHERPGDLLLPAARFTVCKPGARVLTARSLADGALDQVPLPLASPD